MKSEFDPNETRQALDDLIALLDRIPGGERFRKDVQRLKALLVDRRAPRIVIVGRRGHGKSSIANALFGYPKLAVGHVGDQPAGDEWVHLEVQGRQLEWLDTSGIGAGGIAEARLERLKAQIGGAFPDVILLAVKATEVDSEIDATLTGFTAILNVLRTAGCSAPVIVLITKVDELHPARDKVPPYDDAKRALIASAVATLTRHLERHGIQAKATLPVSSYMEFRDLDDTLEFDGRWNVDRLGDALFACLPEEAAVEAARTFRSTRELRRTVAKRIVGAASAVASGIGLAPIPIADVALLAPLQLMMVTAIVYLSGRRTEAKPVAEWIASLGATGLAGLALRTAFQQLLKLLPGPGNLLSGAMAGAGTYAIGTSAVAYFIEDQSLEQAGRIFEKMKNGGGADWTPPEESS
jgi:uncharacterized protein (DUF697 family)